MPPAFVQVRAANGSGTSLALAYLSNNAAGNLLVATAANDGGTVNTLSDSAGNTWGTVRAQNDAGNFCWLGTGEAPNSVASANTVTAAFGGSSVFASIAIAEYSGIETTAPLRDSASSSLVFGTSVSSGNATAVIDDLLLGTGMTSAARAKTPGASYTERADQNADRGIHMQEQIAPSSGDFASSFSWTSGTNSFSHISVYKAAAGGGGGGGPTVPDRIQRSVRIRPAAFSPGWAR